ncbi:hypothetical protein [Endozoicomonas atrinae]|uniref:hypothetical protein n=1 Tax=Endozoicomonas atrinae TaxID=1333660 RepID=UPI003B00FE2C
MNNISPEALSTPAFLRTLCESMEKIREDHGDNVRIGFFNGWTVGLTTEGSETEKMWINFFKQRGVDYCASEGLAMNIVLVRSKIEEIQPLQGAVSNSRGTGISQIRPVFGTSTSNGANAPRRYTESGNILACPSEDMEAGRGGLDRTFGFRDTESMASTSGYMPFPSQSPPLPAIEPVAHNALELPEGLEQNLLRFIEFSNKYCNGHGLSWDMIHDGLHRLKLNQGVLEKLNGFLRKVNQHPEHARQHFTNNPMYGQSETEGSVQNSGQLFSRVSQLMQFMMKDADTDTVSAMLHQAAARQEDDCHDQTLSIVDRLFAERHLSGIKKLVAEFRGRDIDWQDLLIGMRKRFHQDAFDTILGNIRYNDKGDQRPLIEHPEYIALHGMFKKLFSYNSYHGTGVCGFPDDSSSLLFDHWEGTVFEWKNIFNQFTKQFLECIQSEDRFINFLKDAFDDKGEGSLGEAFDKMPEVAEKLSVVQNASHELLEVFEDPDSQVALSLFNDLGATRTQALRQARDELIRDKVRRYKGEVENTLPIHTISIHRLVITEKSMRLRGGGGVYHANVVQVSHEPVNNSV